MSYSTDVDMTLTSQKEGAGAATALTCHVNSFQKQVTGEQRNITARCDLATKTRVVRTTTTITSELKVPIGGALYADGDVGDEYSLVFKSDSTASAETFVNAVLTEMSLSSPEGGVQTQSVSFAINGA
jgi:uncharacterized protein (DUF3084 family)